MVHSAVILVPSGDLYIRFFEGIGKMSNYVCPIRESPHYRFAYVLLEKVYQGEKVTLPLNSDYGRYVEWEEYCLGGSMGHSPKRFYNHIAQWTKNFDLKSNLPQVMTFNPDQFFIFDGVHRLAFSCALIDLKQLNDRLPVQLLIPEQKVVPVLGIKDILDCSDYLGFKK